MNRCVESAAYYAGVFDGEGSVFMQVAHKNARAWRPYHVVRCTMALTNEAVICGLREAFGGSVSGNTTGLREGRKMLWQWSVTGRNAVAFMEIVRPYSRIKAPELDVALAC